LANGQVFITMIKTITLHEQPNMIDDVTEIVFDQSEKFKIIELYFEEKFEMFGIDFESAMDGEELELSSIGLALILYGVINNIDEFINAQKNLGADYDILRLFKRFATTIDDTFPPKSIELFKMFFKKFDIDILSASPNKKAISNNTVIVAHSFKQLYEAKIFGMEKSIYSLSKQVKQISDENRHLNTKINVLEKKLKEERMRRKESEETAEQKAVDYDILSNKLNAVNNEKSLIEKKYNEALDSVVDKELRLKWQEKDEEEMKKLRKTVEILQLEYIQSNKELSHLYALKSDMDAQTEELSWYKEQLQNNSKQMQELIEHLNNSREEFKRYSIEMDKKMENATYELVITRNELEKERATIRH
jgi:hypothetical protein